MKRLSILLIALGATLALSAENYTKAGVYDVAEGSLVKSVAEPCYVGVTLDVETTSFTPGIYARYAQKY